MKNKYFVMVVMFLAVISNAYSQEKPPLKTYEFNVGVNHLKTQEQADNITNKIKALSGVSDCYLILIDYNLHFVCTNYDLIDYQIMDQVKIILSENGVGITQVNQTIKSSNHETNK